MGCRLATLTGRKPAESKCGLRCTTWASILLSRPAEAITSSTTIVKRLTKRWLQPIHQNNTTWGPSKEDCQKQNSLRARIRIRA